MDRIVVDQASSIKFGAVVSPAELCDEAGHVLGYFTPAQSASIYESVQVPFSEAELDEMEREEGGRGLAEIMADLERRK